MTVDAWVSALHDRHAAGMTRSEFLKAIRALSARYVERRAALRARSPLDTAGKRAAFAAFYAPLHFFTTREIVRALDTPGLKARGSIGKESARGSIGEKPARGAIRNLVDLGCGTGVASAAWALERDPRPSIAGVDANAWVLAEARWNWRQLGLRGETERLDLVRAAERLDAARRPSLDGVGIVAGWSVNELEHADRARLLPLLLDCASRGATVLVVEPIAGMGWWGDWEKAFVGAGGAATSWTFDAALPEAIAQVSAEAGFRREALKARSLLI